jgi:hypothetical protein
MRDIPIIIISVPFLVIYALLILIAVPIFGILSIVGGIALAIHAVVLLIYEAIVVGPEKPGDI